MDFVNTIRKWNKNLRKWKSKNEELLRQVEIVWGLAIVLYIFVSLFQIHQYNSNGEYRTIEFEQLKNDTKHGYNLTFEYIINETAHGGRNNAAVAGVYWPSTGTIVVTNGWTKQIFWHEVCHGLIDKWDCKSFYCGGKLMNYQESTCVLFEIWKVPETDEYIRWSNAMNIPYIDNTNYTRYNSSFLKRKCLDKYFNDFEKNCKGGIGFNESLC